MTTELTYFTATGHWYNIESASPGGTTSNLQFQVISGFVQFYPRLPTGWTAHIADLDLGDEGVADTDLAIAPILGRIYQGRLSTIDRADTEGVQLLANSSAISSQIALINDNVGLVYDVAFSEVVYASAQRHLSNFAFRAPTDSSAICLTDPTLTRLEYLGP